VAYDHQYGKDEMNAKNNHGTCWIMQVASLQNSQTIQKFLTFAGLVIKKFSFQIRWQQMEVSHRN